MAGVYKHEDVWSEVMFNEWAADSVKVDHMCADVCEKAPGEINHPSDQIVPAFQQSTIERWTAAIAAINKTDQVLFNNCGIGCSPSEGVDSRDPRPWAEWCRDNANTWRSSGDINVQSWHNNLESLIGRGALSKPGGWNYPDSLEVGNCHRTACIHGAEARAHFSLWCITSSPLYLGMRLDNITDANLAIVSNADAISINQAWAGFAGDMLNFSATSVLPVNVSKSNYSRLPEDSVWWKPLPNNGAAVVLYASRGNATISFELSELQYQGKTALPAGTKGCKSVKSVWEGGKELGPLCGDTFSAAVPAGDVVMVIFSGCAEGALDS